MFHPAEKKSRLPTSWGSLLIDNQYRVLLSLRERNPKSGLPLESLNQSGAEEGRTPDLYIANVALSQLSYRPNGHSEVSGSATAGLYSTDD